MAFIAGPSSCSYNALALGQSQDGYALDFSLFFEPVRGDNLADAIQDLITRGADAYLSTVLIEYNAAGAQSAFWPQNAVFGTQGQVGRISASAIGGVTLAKPMILTAIAGTTASATPATLTAALSILAPNFNVNLLFAPRLRVVPLRLQCLPNSSLVSFALA